VPRARHRRWAAWGWTDRERSASKLLGAPPWLDDVVGAFGLPSPLMSATAESATTYFCFLPLRPSREVSLGPEVMDAARLTEPQAEHMVRVVGTFLMDKRTALKGRCVVSVSVCASEASYQVPWWRLQPCVEEAATVRGGGCNRAWRRLQPCVEEAATVRVCPRHVHPVCTC